VVENLAGKMPAIKMILVAAGLIVKEDQLLITQRRPGKHGALKWEFPGGKIEMDEDPRKCLEREIREELGIKVEAQQIVETVFHKYPDRSVLLLFYRCRFISGEPVAIDCHNFCWIKPSQLNDFDFLEADLDFIRRLATKNL
jgi:8-oxo-dGTP diphosphatase